MVHSDDGAVYEVLPCVLLSWVQAIEARHDVAPVYEALPCVPLSVIRAIEVLIYVALPEVGALVLLFSVAYALLSHSALVLNVDVLGDADIVLVLHNFVAARVFRPCEVLNATRASISLQYQNHPSHQRMEHALVPF